MMHTLNVLKDKRATDNGNIPNLVNMLAEMPLGIRHDSKLYIYNAFPVPSKDQFSLEVLITRTFIKCT